MLCTLVFLSFYSQKNNILLVCPLLLQAFSTLCLFFSCYILAHKRPFYTLKTSNFFLQFKCPLRTAIFKCKKQLRTMMNNIIKFSRLGKIKDTNTAIIRNTRYSTSICSPRNPPHLIYMLTQCLYTSLCRHIP
jgi:hypothetical protein